MKTLRVLRVLGLILVLALLISAPASAGRGVVQFRGHISGVGPGQFDTGTASPLSGGRTLITGGKLSFCYVADEVDPAHDYITGCWQVEYSEIIQPSGAIRTWGSARSLFLTNAPGAGWVGEFEGEWTPPTETGLPKIISLQNQSEGTGTIEGWTMQWREWAMDYWNEVDFGHFTPPK